MERIVETFKAWDEKAVGAIGNRPLGRIVSRDEIIKNDYNISPSRYIHTADGEEYRPLSEIIDDLQSLEEEIGKTDKSLKTILEQFGA